MFIILWLALLILPIEVAHLKSYFLDKLSMFLYINLFLCIFHLLYLNFI